MTQSSSENDEKPFNRRVERFLFGSPRDLSDKSLFHRMSLVALLAWIGLGADGLSSSSYGPEEAFRTLGDHRYLAVALAVMVVATISVISWAYSRIIERFPHGGGGYVVATNLLGQGAGIVSGSALLVDYGLTIAVSIAAAGDALFSFLPAEWYHARLVCEVGALLFLVILNIRGVRESVLALAPIFLLFIVTHAVLIFGGLIAHAPQAAHTIEVNARAFSTGLSALGVGGMLFLLLRAYSMGAGTYTGIEAVSNGLQIMREPRIQTGKRTMLFMALSLAITASGLMICYLLWQIDPTPGKTYNAVLAERFAASFPGGSAFVVLTLLSEGAILIVAAQAGFIDGPRILANMAVDNWVPTRFASLSDRLTTRNGIVMMGAFSLVALLYTHGDVRHLVVMYSINVFLTFSLSMCGMLRSSIRERNWRHAVLFTVGFALCATVLVATASIKFSEGGWMTLVITGIVVILCWAVKRHYRSIGRRIVASFESLLSAPLLDMAPAREFDPAGRTAAVLVSGYGGIGMHTVFNILRNFPGQFDNLLFISVGLMDSAALRHDDPVEALDRRTEDDLKKYVDLAHRLGMPAQYRYGIDTDVVEQAEKLCLQVAQEMPKTTFFAGRIVFRTNRWHYSLLHNDFAFALQRRLQFADKILVVIPGRI